MSTWHEIPDKDIDIDWQSEEVALLINGDYCGNNYATLTFDQIESLHSQIYMQAYRRKAIGHTKE